MHGSPHTGGTTSALSAGLGVLPSFFGLQLVFPQSGMVQEVSDLSPEQVQQAYLSRLLLLLGSFVILCLLLF